jgi:hypothetical protein
MEINLKMSLQVRGMSMRSPTGRGSTRLAAMMLLNIALCNSATSQTEIESVPATLNRLSIELPTNLIVNQPVRSPLEALSREPCPLPASGAR